MDFLFEEASVSQRIFIACFNHLEIYFFLFCLINIHFTLKSSLPFKQLFIHLSADCRIRKLLVEANYSQGKFSGSITNEKLDPAYSAILLVC